MSEDETKCYYNKEHERYHQEHEDVQCDEDYEMNLGALDRKKLWGLSAAKCSICKCGLFLKEETDITDTNIGNECHISSHKPNHPCKEFSRYVDNLSEQERDKNYDNAILLCSIHHTIIDNCKNTNYTLEILHQIKSEHEAWVVGKLEENTDESIDLQERIEEVVRKIRIYGQEFNLNKKRYKWLKGELHSVLPDHVIKSIFQSSTTENLENSFEEYGIETDILISCPNCNTNLVYDPNTNTMICKKCDQYFN